MRPPTAGRGDDWKTMLITTFGEMGRMRVKIPGIPVHGERFRAVGINEYGVLNGIPPACL